MEMRKTARIWLLICLSFHGPCIKALQLESLLAGPERITFSLSGEVGTIYLVESSPDLKNWTQLFSGTFTNATVELFDLAPVSAGFYRARTQIEATPPINVLPAADSTRTFTTLLTEEESVAEIYLQTATPIRLRFGTNSVGSLETVAITPVTNIVNLPFSGPLLAAVLVQGSTTESIHAASLELPIPPDIDRRFIISFTAGLDGKNLALVPHLLWTNHLAIPFTRAGLFGAALATTQEIASVAARLEALAQSSSLHAFSTSDQRLVRASASALVCFPEEAAEAQTIRRELLQQLQIEDSLTASYMGFIRAQQLVGTKVDTAATYAMFTSERCKFYQNNIEPLWAKAERNCLLHTYLLQISLSMANQAAVMGLPSEGNCVRDILAQRLCAGMLNCVKEIKECCETHSQGRDRLKDLLGITRQRDLAGLQGACDGTIDAALEDAFKACSALAWTGKFRVKAKGKSVVTRTFPLGFSEDTVSTETYFLGHVFSSTETSLGSFGRFVELKIGGDFSAKNIDKRYSETSSLCGNKISLFHSEEFTAIEQFYRVTLTIQTNGNYSITGIFFGDDQGNFIAKGRETNTEVRAIGPTDINCEGFEHVTTRTQEDASFGGPSLGPVEFTAGTTPEHIKDKKTITPISSQPVVTMEFEWDFQRRPQG